MSGKERKSWVRWSESDDDYIRTWYREKSASEISDIVGHSVQAVRRRASVLGVKADGMVRYGRHIRPWTQNEDKLLMALCTRYNVREVAEMLGRGVEAVKWRKQKLGIYYKPPLYDGKVRIDKTVEGSYVVKIFRGGKWRHFTRWLWEERVGKIPPDHVIEIIDGNPLHCRDINNLECIPRKRHLMRVNKAVETIDEADARYAVSEIKRIIKEKKNGNHTTGR